jgi:nucleoside-diphosphate-sugar epimerase
MVRELSGNREPLAHLPEREGDIRHSRASVEAFREATGWNPEFSLGTGLAATLEWYASTRAPAARAAAESAGKPL